MGSIYQSIELLSKEKGIETQIVLDAVKDALLVAARKHYRTNENYIAELNEKRDRSTFCGEKSSRNSRIRVEMTQEAGGSIRRLSSRPNSHPKSMITGPHLGPTAAGDFQKVREPSRKPSITNIPDASASVGCP
jgi:hypothetical protein